MAPLHVPLRLLLLIAGVGASPAPSIFFARQDVCKAQGLTACSNGLPDNFCCGSNSKCLALAGNTTVLCCPNDRGCTKIQPITCDLGAQDPTKNPKAPIKTSVTGAKLPKCGENFCCPFGYTCVGDKSCQLDSDQSKKPDGVSTTSAPSATSAPTSTATQSEASASATTSKTSESTDSPSSEPTKISIIGGSIGGGLALLLIGVIILVCMRCRRRDKPAEKSPGSARSSSSGFHGKPISNPTLNHPDASYRSDFIRQSPSMRSKMRQSIASRFSRIPRLHENQATNPRISIPNPFDSPNLSTHSPAMTRSSFASHHDEGYARTGQVAGAQLAPIRAMKASSKCSRRTSTLNVQREPSSESINVFADPTTVNNTTKAGGAAYNRTTTFSDLMEEASMGDVHKGGHYVPRTPRKHVPGTTPKI